MKQPDDPSDDDIEAIADEVTDLSKMSGDELRTHLLKRIERLRRERRELSDRLQELDPASEVYDSLADDLEEMSKQSRDTEAHLARMQKRQTGLTSITIENFKGIGKPVTIPLRPITLLFGANSAGKSTILHAIHFVRELLERNNANPDRTQQGGEAIEMGGFRNLVHKHELEREIRVRIEITPTDDGVPTLAELLDLTEEDGSSDASRLNINTQVQTVSLEVVARWDFSREEGVFSECRYFLNDEAGVTIRKPKPESIPVIEQINYFHSALLLLDESLSDEKDYFDELIAEFVGELDSSLAARLLRGGGNPIIDFDVINIDSGQVLIAAGEGISRELIKKVVANLPNVVCTPSAGDLFPQARVEIQEVIRRFEDRKTQLQRDSDFFPMIQLPSQISVAPSLARGLPFSPTALGQNREQYFPLVNQIVVGITSLVRSCLDGFRYIGPIRAIPDRYHECPQLEESSRWASGLGGWDMLLRHYDRAKGKGDKFVEEVSKWFEDNERLGLGYRIDVAGLRSVAEGSLLMNHLKLLQTQYDERSQHDFREKVLNPLRSTPQTPRIRIIDTRNDTEVGPKDIGIGVAQALPIVVGALDSRSPFLAVEQPELHLHPAAQAKLGDLFVTQSKQERLFLIETHSETLMLRIFRRIRETTRKKLPRKELECSNEDVALLFVTAGESGAQIKMIRLDDQGKFVDSVPGGFFEEGFDELF